MTRILLATAAALALGTSAVTAETVGIDANGDGLVTADEYTKASSETDYSASIDTDGDGVVSREEFTAAIWAMYDTDEDGQWSAEEAAAFDSAYIRAGKKKQ